MVGWLKIGCEKAVVPPWINQINRVTARPCIHIIPRKRMARKAIRDGGKKRPIKSMMRWERERERKTRRRRNTNRRRSRGRKV